MERFWCVEDTQRWAVAAIWSIWGRCGRLQITGRGPALASADRPNTSRSGEANQGENGGQSNKENGSLEFISLKSQKREIFLIFIIIIFFCSTQENN